MFARHFPISPKIQKWQICTWIYVLTLQRRPTRRMLHDVNILVPFVILLFFITCSQESQQKHQIRRAIGPWRVRSRTSCSSAPLSFFSSLVRAREAAPRTLLARNAPLGDHSRRQNRPFGAPRLDLLVHREGVQK